jgi:hypothetical protein
MTLTCISERGTELHAEDGKLLGALVLAVAKRVGAGSV